MNASTYVTTTQSGQARHWIKIRAINVGSAVKYGALFSAVYALLTGIPATISVMAIEHVIIDFLTPVIKLFHGSVPGVLASANNITFLVLLFYVLATVLFSCVFIALAASAYNLLARFTCGLTLQVEETGKNRGDGPPLEMICAAARSAAAQETPVEEVDKQREDGPPVEVLGETADGTAAQEASIAMGDSVSDRKGSST